MEYRHILITGARHVGKSFLIRRLLAHTKRPVCGFMTKSLPADEAGFHPIYIHPADQPVAERRYTPENWIGTCNGRSREIHLAAFDTCGVEYLSHLPADGLVVMDELGFMEVGSAAFTDRVLELLDGDRPVLAAVKDRTDIDFLNTVRAHPKALVVTISEENREELYEQLRPVMETL